MSNYSIKWEVDSVCINRILPWGWTITITQGKTDSIFLKQFEKQIFVAVSDDAWIGFISIFFKF